jgi:hypothetical protein
MRRLYLAALCLLSVSSLFFVEGAAAQKKKANTLAAAKKETKKSKAITPPTPSGGKDNIVFIGVGDTMMGSDYPDKSGLPDDDGAGMLKEVTPYLSAADIAFGNLEGPLLDGGSSAKCKPKEKGCYAFRVPTRYGEHLKDAGFDVMSLANNHGMDFGEEGLNSSTKALDALGIAHTGKIGDIAYVAAKDKTIAVIGFAARPTYLSPTFYDLEQAKELIDEASKKTDLIVISFHGGREGATAQSFKRDDGVNADLEKFAHFVIDNGADLVIGHGPHVLRGMEIYSGRLIAYSMGNFATYKKFTLKGPTALTAMLEVHLAKDGAFVKGQIHPLKQPFPGGPLLDPTGESISVMKSLTEEDFPKSGVVIAEDGSFVAPKP